MDSVKGSESLNVFIPEDLLINHSRDYDKSFLLGWEGIKGQFFIIDAYSASDKLSKVLDSIKKDSNLENITWMKNGLQLLDHFTLNINGEKGEFINLSLTDILSGKEVQKVVTFVYKNEYFDLKSSDLFENLKVKTENSSDCLDPNCAIGPCLLLATLIRNYIRRMLYIEQNDQTHLCDLKFINSFNRKSSLLSHSRFIVYLVFVKFTFYLSLFTNCILRFLNLRAGRLIRFLKFIPKYSRFFSLLIYRLTILSQWHISYKELLSKTQMSEYFELRNELLNFATSMYISLFGGLLEFFLFRKVTFERKNEVSQFTIIVFRSLFYYLTTKIFIYIKLNNEVSASLAKFVVNKVMVWRYLKEKLEPIRLFLLKALEYSALLGLSAQASVFYDLFAFETLRLYYLYFIMLSIMSYTQKYLYTLLLLFKGKKWNVLKSVLDTNEFTKEQLFIGVVFFVIFALNYPTIWIFYISSVTILAPILRKVNLNYLVVKVLIHSFVELLSGLPYYVLAHNAFSKKYIEGVYFRKIEGTLHSKFILSDNSKVYKSGTLNVSKILLFIGYDLS
ncbi:N-acetylglucosaminyl transferase, putative [Theileria annulata]|uniref:N-acetylglucosaminyl transferase, putative n=1 Tax=Theileria annulata TaxID=5874 RepID=Q4U8H3_THEAN|nr:N-acetylglucosaminyl transferase, putative [Theileria annulata]CAI76880.1 N-acetylglucosaminyl transferase, putative [Theileria annulata]|eukprot:XP_953505.1 N-acetylglucosaminyl transferase, putative [Theileria annulata]